jgi:cytochrome c
MPDHNRRTLREEAGAFGYHQKMMHKTYLRVIAGGLAGAALAFAGAAGAQTTGQDLAASRQCLACHQVDTKRVGPPLASVAERYVGQPNAQDYIAARIRGGSRGMWGAVPMPAQTQVSEEDARLLAQWVLSLAPGKPADK